MANLLRPLTKASRSLSAKQGQKQARHRNLYWWCRKNSRPSPVLRSHYRMPRHTSPLLLLTNAPASMQKLAPLMINRLLQVIKTCFATVPPRASRNVPLLLLKLERQPPLEGICRLYSRASPSTTAHRRSFCSVLCSDS